MDAGPPVSSEASCGALPRLAMENSKLEKLWCAGVGVFGGGTWPERPFSESLSCTSLSKPKSKPARGDEEDVSQSGFAVLPEIPRRRGSPENSPTALKLSTAEDPARLRSCPCSEELASLLAGLKDVAPGDPLPAKLKDLASGVTGFCDSLADVIALAKSEEEEISL